MSEFRLEAPTFLNLCSRSEVQQAERRFKGMSVTGVDSMAQAEYRQEQSSVACLPSRSTCVRAAVCVLVLGTLSRNFKEIKQAFPRDPQGRCD